MSLPGNASDPWDRDAAEALTGHYESGAPDIQRKGPPPTICLHAQ